MKGRKPKDIALKVLAGNPGKRPVPDEGWQPFIADDIEKPAALDSYASAEWDRLIDSLGRVLCSASRGMLFCAVNAYSQLMTADEIIQRLGLTYETHGDAGTVVRMRP